MSATPEKQPESISHVKTLADALAEPMSAGETQLLQNWQLRIVQNQECMSYFVWNTKTHEGLIIDPKREDQEADLKLLKELSSVRWLGVIDTHTHADHISLASEMADATRAPLIMHEKAVSRRVDLRVSKNTRLAAQAGPIELVFTPGHTPDGICVSWGPFVFTGDTVLYGDVGRDDLPGGDPTSHYESLEVLKERIRPDQLVCPGHDHKGGRISSWATQLKVNSSLTQPKDEYVQESLAFDAPAPKLLKKSLAENFK